MRDEKSLDLYGGGESGLNCSSADLPFRLDLPEYQFFDWQTHCQTYGIPSLELTGVIVASLKESSEILKQAESDILSASTYMNEVQIQKEDRWCRRCPAETAKEKSEASKIRHIYRTKSKELKLYNSANTVNDAHSSVAKIMAIITANEGSAETINWDDNGSGISVGAFQANQKYGELPLLLSRMQRSNPELFEEMFGKAFANVVIQEPQLVRLLQFTDSLHKGPNQLGYRLQASLRRKEFQQTQWAMLTEKILQSQRLALTFGVHSEKGVALVADMVNQLGLGDDSCGAKHYLRFALGKRSEMEKLEAIVANDYKNYGRSSRDRRILNNAALSAEEPFVI